MPEPAAPGPSGGGGLLASFVRGAARGEGILVGEPDDVRRLPDAARTYLSDGRAVAWAVPLQIRDDVARAAGRASDPAGERAGAFTLELALDAEVPGPVRPSLARRYGVDDPQEFARRWTRAEALAKLEDTPIITWLSRHGLEVPVTWEGSRPMGLAAWETAAHPGGFVLTAACRLRRSS